MEFLLYHEVSSAICGPGRRAAADAAMAAAFAGVSRAMLTTVLNPSVLTHAKTSLSGMVQEGPDPPPSAGADLVTAS